MTGLLRLAALGLLAVVAAACTTGASERELAELREAGLVLVPPGGSVVGTSEGACVRLRGNPTCVRIYFTADLPVEERVDAVVEAGRAEGWRPVSRERVRDGTWLQLERDGFRAYIAMWDDEHSAPCREGRPARDCADELHVIED